MILTTKFLDFQCFYNIFDRENFARSLNRKYPDDSFSPSTFEKFTIFPLISICTLPYPYTLLVCTLICPSSHFYTIIYSYKPKSNHFNMPKVTHLPFFTKFSLYILLHSKTHFYSNIHSYAIIYCLITKFSYDILK